MSPSRAEQDPDGLHWSAEQPLHFQAMLEGMEPQKKRIKRQTGREQKAGAIVEAR
jgi:hypothetical protein